MLILEFPHSKTSISNIFSEHFKTFSYKNFKKDKQKTAMQLMSEVYTLSTLLGNGND